MIMGFKVCVVDCISLNRGININEIPRGEQWNGGHSPEGVMLLSAP